MAQFLVIGFDGTDTEALNRRLAARDAHLSSTGDLQKTGNALFAAALLNPEDNMSGSAMVMDFPSREDLETWLKSEPYITGEVWQRLMIFPCKVGPTFAPKPPKA